MKGRGLESIGLKYNHEQLCNSDSHGNSITNYLKINYKRKNKAVKSTIAFKDI